MSRPSIARRTGLPYEPSRAPRPAAPRIRPEREEQFQQSVIDLARMLGWGLIYHTRDSRRSASGFPDLILIRPPRLVAIECKVERGIVRANQQIWLEAIRSCHGCEAYVFRPSDMPEIVKVLSR